MKSVYSCLTQDMANIKLIDSKVYIDSDPFCLSRYCVSIKITQKVMRIQLCITGKRGNWLVFSATFDIFLRQNTTRVQVAGQT